MASDCGVTEKAVGTRIFSNMETRYIDPVNDVAAHGHVPDAEKMLRSMLALPDARAALQVET